MASDIKRKIIALLDQVFPEYEKLFSDTFGVTSMELLTKYQIPEQMLSVDSTTLADLLQKASRGRFGIDKAIQIQEFAKNSFGIILASSSLNTLSNLKILNLPSLFLMLRLKRFTILEGCHLHTITGISTTLAAVILSEIGGDISKFESIPKLVAFAGLYPKLPKAKLT